jgi:hypothetical protein
MWREPSTGLDRSALKPLESAVRAVPPKVAPISELGVKTLMTARPEPSKASGTSIEPPAGTVTVVLKLVSRPSTDVSVDEALLVTDREADAPAAVQPVRHEQRTNTPTTRRNGR